MTRAIWQPRAARAGSQIELAKMTDSRCDSQPPHRKYLARVFKMQQPNWACCATGKAELTFEEALEVARTARQTARPHCMQSERRAQNKLKNMPEPMAKLVLQQAHHKDTSVESIVTSVLAEVRKHFHIGEIVQYRPSSSKSCVASVFPARSHAPSQRARAHHKRHRPARFAGHQAMPAYERFAAKISPNVAAALSAAPAQDTSDGAPVDFVKLADSKPGTPNPAEAAAPKTDGVAKEQAYEYGVISVDAADGVDKVVPGTALRRSKELILTRDVIKAFIRENATRPGISKGPWVVHVCSVRAAAAVMRAQEAALAKYAIASGPAPVASETKPRKPKSKSAAEAQQPEAAEEGQPKERKPRSDKGVKRDGRVKADDKPTQSSTKPVEPPLTRLRIDMLSRIQQPNSHPSTSPDPSAHPAEPFRRPHDDPRISAVGYAAPLRFHLNARSTFKHRLGFTKLLQRDISFEYFDVGLRTYWQPTHVLWQLSLRDVYYNSLFSDIAQHLLAAIFDNEDFDIEATLLGIELPVGSIAAKRIN